MKKKTRNLLIGAGCVIIFVVVAYGFVSYSHQPRQYIDEVYGLRIPEKIRISSLHKEDGWDGRLICGTLDVPRDNRDGVANTANFTPVSQTKDNRIRELIADVTKTFSISKVTETSKDVKYQEFTIKDESLFVIFYNETSRQYFFYGTRYWGEWSIKLPHSETN